SILGIAPVGDFMVCQNCGMRFLTSRVNDVSGGCNPAPLNRRVEGDTLYIAAQDIEAGAGFFNFSARGGR
ncbi:MAG: Fe-S-containing protein, partial [Desulfatibacillaceae bacterium]|nr:Fe-S-containing protein [Desulfatibacillaceae bacterium]